MAISGVLSDCSANTAWKKKEFLISLIRNFLLHSFEFNERITGARDPNKEAENPKEYPFLPAEFVEQRRQQQPREDVGERSQGQTRGHLHFRHSY